jgi:hypothetical protein
MKLSCLAVFFVLHSVWGQGTPLMPSGPDFEDLYERMSRSDFVVRGTVIDKSPVWAPMPSDEKELLARKDLVQPLGDVSTLAVGQSVCQRSDFSPAGSTQVPLEGKVRLFTPFRDTTRKSDIHPGRGTAPEYFFPGSEYLLFLTRYPNQAALISTYGLDPAFVYYRAFEGYRGAVKFPDPADQGGRNDIATPVMAAVSALCGAVKAEGTAAKLAQLQALLQTADPRWRDSVSKAISLIEARPLQTPR